MAYQITEAEYQEIKAREKKIKEKRVSKRLKVLMLRYEGRKNDEIGAKLDLTSGRVSHLISEYKQAGLEEYIRNKYDGNHRSMTYEEEQAILDSFAAAGEAGQIITGKEIKAAFDEKPGRGAGRGNIYMLLKRHGWRKIKPRPRHPQRASDEEIAASKK